MKTRNMLLVVISVFMSLQLFSQIKVNSDGSVEFMVSSLENVIIDDGGSNGSPCFRPESSFGGQLGKETNRWHNLFVNSINTEWVYGNTLVNTSDSSMKENILPLKNSLENIKLLDGKTYNLKKRKPASEFEEKYVKSKENEIGLIAQELEKVYPELVYYNKDSKTKGINYIGLIPVIIEALKEQQIIIDKQQDQLNELESCCTNNFFKSANKATNIEENSSIDGAALYQNKPNPFSTDTEIEFSIPEEIESAFIGIYDLNGTQIKSITVTQRGQGSINISANELKPGMYFYSLFADGYEIDTKRMVITEN